MSLTLLLSALALASDPTAVEAAAPAPAAEGTASPAEPAPEGAAPDQAAASDEAAPVEEAASDEEEAAAPAWSPKRPGEPAPDSPHYDLEEIYAAKRYEEGWRLSRERLAAHPDDPELHWMVARFMYEVGELMDKHDPNVDKEAHYAEMVAVSERGLALDPDNLHLRFARGIGNGRLGTTRGVLSSLWLASSVEQDWLAVANADFAYASLDGNEILPCDAQYALGIFYRLVPDLWIVKVLSGTRGSLDKSLQYLQRADRCSPGRPHVAKELGVTQLCIGTRNKDPEMLAAGRASLERVLAMPADTEKEAIDHRHARMLIDDPKMACGYSRDGQQELDEAKIPQ